MMSFANMNLSRQLAMMRLKHFPTVEVRTLGRNELGTEGGPDLCTRMIFPTHQDGGQVWSSSRIREKCCKEMVAGW